MPRAGRRVRPAWLLPALLLLVACAERAPGRAPELNPTEVIAAQLIALKENGGDDAGIERAFRYASPGNRAEIGPLPRFARLLRRDFPAMFSFESAAFATLVVEGSRALQLVTLTQPGGERQAYLYELRRLQTADCDDCWLIDGVLQVAPESPRLTIEGGTI